MSVEQVARNFVMNMNDERKAQAQTTPDAMVDGGMLPRPMPAMEAFRITHGLSEAMPDFNIDVQQVDVNGNLATVKVRWTGTQTGPLDLGIPGMPTVPPTGKKVSVNDKFLVTVQGEKVSQMTVESPMDGGIPAALAQLGVNMPNTPPM